MGHWMSDAIHDLILTRPIARSQAFAKELPPDLRARVSVHFAPLLEIKAIGRRPDLSAHAGVIFSSMSAVAITDPIRSLPAYCIGSRTTKAAKRAGFDARMSGDTADALVVKLSKDRPKAPLLHLHGQHTRGDISKRLSSAGIETESRVIYDQRALKLTNDIRALLISDSPGIVPLFSPRTASLFAEELANAPRSLKVVALSDAVANAIPTHWDVDLRIAKAPNSGAMLAEVSRIIAG